jgi:hypothetical protein
MTGIATTTVTHRPRMPILPHQPMRIGHPTVTRASDTDPTGIGRQRLSPSRPTRGSPRGTRDIGDTAGIPIRCPSVMRPPLQVSDLQSRRNSTTVRRDIPSLVIAAIAGPSRRHPRGISGNPGQQRPPPQGLRLPHRHRRGRDRRVCRPFSNSCRKATSRHTVSRQPPLPKGEGG